MVASVLLVWWHAGLARGQETSEASPEVPAIVLYSMGQGEDLTERFGHSAMCVEYRAHPDRSRCYNYGTTDFGSPVPLGRDFLLGRADFWLSVTTPQRMIEEYTAADRTIWRQQLPLTEEQSQAVASKLEWDARPENRLYVYHHFYDNCTTRLRDIIDEATGGALRRDSSAIAGPSYRDHSRAGFAEQMWLLMLGDFIVGRPADKLPDQWQAMFLPAILRDQVHQRLGATPHVVYERHGRKFASSGPSGRIWMLLLAIALVVPVVITRRCGRLERLGVVLPVVVLVLIALGLWFLAFVSTLEALRWNENLLIFLPIDAVVPIVGKARRHRYAQVRVVQLGAVGLLALLGVFLQPLAFPLLLALLPLVAIGLPSRLVERSP